MALVYHQNLPPEKWDSHLSLAEREAGLCQSTYWAEVIAIVDRAEPLFLEVFRDGCGAGEPPAAMLLAFLKTPWDRRKKRRTGRLKDILLRRSSQWLEWYDGPVILTHDRGTALKALEELLQWLNGFAAAHRLSRISSHGFSHAGRWLDSEEAAGCFSRSGYALTKWASFLVDLTPSQEDIWSSLGHAARKAVKKAQRIGLTITRMESFQQYEALFFKSYNDSERYHRRAEMPLHVAQTSWERDLHHYYSYHVATDSSGAIWGTLGMYIFNNVATEIASSLSPRALSEKVPAQDLLHWELICEAKRRGCHTFDLAGVSPSPADDKEAGIRKFKEKWGGRYIEYYRPTRTMPYSMSLFEKALRRSCRLIYGRTSSPQA